jgi:hypothetical protein
MSSIRPTRAALIASIVLGTCCLLYCLIAGTAYRLFRKDAISTTSFNTICAPLLCCARHSQACARILDRYFLLWYSDEQELRSYFQRLKDREAHEGATPRHPPERPPEETNTVPTHTSGR